MSEVISDIGRINREDAYRKSLLSQAKIDGQKRILPRSMGQGNSSTKVSARRSSVLKYLERTGGATALQVSVSFRVNLNTSKNDLGRLLIEGKVCKSGKKYKLMEG